MEWGDIYDRKIADEAPASQEKEGLRASLKKNESNPGENLEEKLQEQKQIAEENYQKFLRLYAEFINYRKRAAKEKENFLDYANEELMLDLLPFIDNLERATEQGSSEGNSHVQAFIKGIQLALKDLMTVLGRHGLKPIEAMGRPFDPNIHDAVSVVQAVSYPLNTVIAEARKGYLFKGRLLRPARVIVSLTPEPKTEKELGPS